MGPDSTDERQWTRTPSGKVVLRLIEEWKAGLTEHGDIVLSFTSKQGNDPAIPSGKVSRSQFICTQEDALQIARMLLRTLAFCEQSEASDFAAFRSRIEAPALRALADDWNEARGSRPMPCWDDINPDIAAPYLGGMWGFDQDRASGEFIGRLAGSNIMLAFGKNFLGIPLRDLHPPHVYVLAHANFSRVLSGPACCRFSGKLFRTANTVVEGERLVLPVAGDAMNPAGVLGASCYDDYSLSRTPEHMELLGDREDWCRL